VAYVKNQTLHLAVVLHMHQPRYNMTGHSYESEMARDVFSQTLHPYTYPASVLQKVDNAKITINFTGTLIEQLDELSGVGFDPRLRGLWDAYREACRLGRAEFTGCGYYHPLFPLIPGEDAERQIEAHFDIYEKTFGGRPEGFWLPELAFSMKLIPTLARAGVKWALVDGPHVVNANREKDWSQLTYRPHYVEFEGQRIIIVPRDRIISIAQQSGYDPKWLKNEITQRIQPRNDGDFLLTVATDGENGWFRHQGENAGFWGWFFEPLLHLLKKEADFDFIRLTTITDYLKEHPPRDTVKVEDGSWNVPDTSDDGRFLKWTGDEQRQKTWNHVLETSRLVHEAQKKASSLGTQCAPEVEDLLEEAWRWILMSEASDNFWWGSQDWLNRSIVASSKGREKVDEALKLCHAH